MAKLTELINVNELQFGSDGLADILPTLIPNTLMKARRSSVGASIYVLITPTNGYVMHDATFDASGFFPEYDENGNVIFDENGNPVGEEKTKLGYRPHEASVKGDGVNAYDFATVEMLDEEGNTVTAYGNRLFYCKLASDVPTDQIFGVVERPEVK